jgi:hypothetical protein
MTKTPSKTQILLARLVVVPMVALIVLGLAWNGFSHEDRVRLWQNIIDRPGGPMTFRFILQPAMATLAALFDGIKDARTGRSPYFWTILSNPAARRSPARRTDLDIPDRSPGARDGRDLSGHRTQGVLSGRGCDRCVVACLYPVSVAARAHRANWALVACRCPRKSGSIRSYGASAPVTSDFAMDLQLMASHSDHGVAQSNGQPTVR